MLDEKELKHRRNLLREQLQTYYKKHYDGRPLIGPYLEVTKILMEQYNNPTMTSVGDWAKPDYWDKESSRDMQHLNRNPIIDVKDYRAVRRYPYYQPTNKAPRTAIKPIAVPIELAPTDSPVICNNLKAAKKYAETKVNVPIHPIPSIQPKNSYYKIIISWTEHDGISYDLVDRAERFFNELGLEQCHTETVTNGYTKEHSIEYKFNGTEEGYKLLKRAAMTMIDVFNDGPEQVQIAIYGKKINEI